MWCVCACVYGVPSTVWWFRQSVLRSPALFRHRWTERRTPSRSALISDAMCSVIRREARRRWEEGWGGVYDGRKKVKKESKSDRKKEYERLKEFWQVAKTERGEQRNGKWKIGNKGKYLGGGRFRKDSLSGCWRLKSTAYQERFWRKEEQKVDIKTRRQDDKSTRIMT